MKAVLLHGSNDNYGASKVLLDEVRILVSRGFTVTVIVPTNGPLGPLCHDLGAELIVDEQLIVLRRANITDALGYPKLPTRACDADLLILWTLAMAAYIPHLRMSRIPFYVSVHELLDGLIGRALTALLKLGNFPIVCCSRAVANWIIQSGIDSRRVHVMYPIVSIAVDSVISARPAPEVLRIGVVGRLNGHKGHLEVINAVQHHLVSVGRDLELRIYGGPFPGQEGAADQIRDAAIRDTRVRMMGEVTDMEIQLQQLDLVACFPRKPEPFGLVPIEAWAAGTRTVGYLDGGAQEVIPSVGGIGFERGVSIHKCLAFVVDRYECLPPLPDSSHVLETYSECSRRNVLDQVIGAL